jgi:hypothetical protein
VLAPIFLHRLVHEALCAHFLLLAAMTWAVRREPPPRLGPVLLPAFTVGVHPYLAVMVLAVCAAALVRDAAGRWRSTLLRLALAVALVVGMAALLGYFAHRGEDIGGRGFGKWNSDLASFIIPDGHSRIWPKLPMRFGEGEGCGFLGVGVLALGLSGLGLELWAVRRREPRLPWRRVAPTIGAAVLCALLAYAGKLDLCGHEILDFSFLYPAGIGATFRSSGRFIWVASYLLTTGALAVWLARRPRVAPVAIGLAFVVQLADTNGVFFARRIGTKQAAPRQSPTWQLAAGDYDHMALYPPRCGDGGALCCEGLSRAPLPQDMYLAALATRLGLTYNGFGAARVPRAAHRPACAALQADILAGRLDPRTVYVVAKDEEQSFRAHNPTAPCRKLDAELVCVAGAAEGRLRAALEAP